MIPMTVVITIQVDDDVIKAIEDLGYDPEEFTRRTLIKSIKKDRAKEALNWLKKNRLPPGEKSSTEMIREDRDSR
jgi:hydrogenase maturation factor